MKKLTRRQAEVVKYLLAGMSQKEVAAIMQIKPSTVDSHLIYIFHNLNVSSVRQLMALFICEKSIEKLERMTEK